MTVEVVRETPRLHPADAAQATTTELVEWARGRDDTAWNAIVDRYERLVWSVAAGFRFDDAIRQDIAQNVWLKLFHNLDRIREPEGLGAWLAITTKRHAIDVKRKRDRLIAMGDTIEETLPAVWIDEEGLMSAAEMTAMRRAFSCLSDDQQLLLRLLICDPPLSYKEIAEIIGRPVGSIGPTRRRTLDRLRRAYLAEGGGQP